MNMNDIERSRILMLDTAIKHMENIRGTDVRILREAAHTPDTIRADEQDVYGMYAGSNAATTEAMTQVVQKTRILLTGNHFSAFAVGGFDLAYAEELELFTSLDFLRAGDIIAVDRNDEQHNGFEVIREESLGYTTSVLRKFIITPIQFPERF